MASIRFNVKPAANKLLQIRAIFQDGSAQHFKNIGESIPANKLKDGYKYWDGDAQLVRNVESEDRINTKIQKWKMQFSSYKEECKRLDISPDIPKFIQSLSGKAIISDSPTLLEVMNTYYNSIKESHAANTYNHYKVLINQVEKFQKEKRRTIYIKDVDRAFHKSFCEFLMKGGNVNNTILHKQSHFITLLKRAVKELKLKSVCPDFDEPYQIKTTPSIKFPLFPEELATLDAAILSNPLHRIVLDAFLFACETGLRHSDIIQLKYNHISSAVAHDGSIIKFISLHAVKTNKQNNVPLSEKAIKILDRYPETDNAVIFKLHYSQSASKILKTIFDDLKLNRICETLKMTGAKTTRAQVPLSSIISFHMARNTYITRLLRSNLAPSYVKDNAGHSDIKVTMGYYRNDDMLRWEETLKILNQKENAKSVAPTATNNTAQQE